jgi:hypothetical protein
VRVSDAIDSDVLLSFRFAAAAVPEFGPRMFVAGRLAEVDDPDHPSHEGVPVLWMDEVLALSMRFDKVPAGVYRARRDFGGEVTLDRTGLVAVFGEPGSRTREEINDLWRGWGRLDRRSWIRRKTWAAARMVGSGVDPEEAAGWSASYATDRMLGEEEF